MAEPLRPRPDRPDSLDEPYGSSDFGSDDFGGEGVDGEDLDAGFDEPFGDDDTEETHRGGFGEFGGASGGQYIRLPGAPQTWLVRGVTNVPAPHAADAILELRATRAGAR